MKIQLRFLMEQIKWNSMCNSMYMNGIDSLGIFIRNILPGVGKYVQKCSFYLAIVFPSSHKLFVFHSPKIQNRQCFSLQQIFSVLYSFEFIEYALRTQYIAKMRAVDGLFSLLTEMATTDTMPSNFIYIFQPELASNRKSMANFEKESEMLFKWICAWNACLRINVFVVCEFYVYFVVYVCRFAPLFSHICLWDQRRSVCVCRVFMFLFFFFIFWLK